MARFTISTNTVEAIVASLSVVLGLIFLRTLEGLFSVKVYSPPMLGAMIVLALNPEPPSPTTFLVATAYSVVSGVAIQSVLSGTDAAFAAAGGLLLFCKLSGYVFIGAIPLAAQLATSKWVSLTHLLLEQLAPWLMGHTLLYAFACTASLPRAATRVRLAKREWAHALGESEGDVESRLRAVFVQYDTSGDGRIDAPELKVAQRALFGLELSIEECEALIRSVDTDGDGAIDFDEFLHALEPSLGHKVKSA